ncbi:DUF5343 domain-containing protein [Aquipseudomonas alcaligenes]|uniref:DUF5343 domain-containing protein n=1 Tax=Aquipseudomonas alcaligenes TaxID=43263 RepID=UPI0035B25F7F
MASTLPYLATPGSITTALNRIRAAATPDRVTTDFVTTKLQIKGGTGAAIIPYLKKIGFVASDGSPTDLYKRFRNQATGGLAVADAIKVGYKDLLQVNEYFYELAEKDLLALIVQVTGADAENKTAKLTLSTLKALKAFAEFEGGGVADSDQGFTELKAVSSPQPQLPNSHGKVGLNLSYTINLNLPATTDQAVFNAIFRSLKEHLLSNEE